MKNEKSKFVSSDFYLSSYLLTQKFKLLSIDRSKDPHKVLFVFQDKKGRQGLVEDFLFGRTTVEPKSFVTAIKTLKQLLHSNL